MNFKRTHAAHCLSDTSRVFLPFFSHQSVGSVSALRNSYGPLLTSVYFEFFHSRKRREVNRGPQEFRSDDMSEYQSTRYSDQSLSIPFQPPQSAAISLQLRPKTIFIFRVQLLHVKRLWLKRKNNSWVRSLLTR